MYYKVTSIKIAMNDKIYFIERTDVFEEFITNCHSVVQIYLMAPIQFSIYYQWLIC